MRPYRPYALVALLIAAAYLTGWFDFFDRNMMDVRARLHSRAASGELVVVAIDPASLHALERWPWPRRYHAEAIRRLVAAGARRIAYDIDFSSPSDPVNDHLLSEALDVAGPERIALPVFRQLRLAYDARVEPIETASLPLFRQHVGAASINVRPDPDGLVRRIQPFATWSGSRVPSMPVWLLDDPTVAPREVLIDFTIDPSTIPWISFIDVLRGTFDPRLVAGKRVMVGSGAVELGDWTSVPSYRALPGPMVQALAFETLFQHRNLWHVHGWPVALCGSLLTLLFGPLFGRMPWRRGLVLFGSYLTVITTLSAGLQCWGAIALDTSAPLAALLLAFSVAMLTQIERQARAMRQLVDGSFDAIVTFEGHGRILSYNRAAERIFGIPAAEVIGGSIDLLLPDQHAAALGSVVQEGGSRELAARHASGRGFPVEATLSRTHVDQRWVGIAILRDITERKTQHLELERMALHDALTGLPNRTLLNDRIMHAISGARRAQHTMAVLLLDLDRFKDLNDTLGHHVGDLLLTQVGPRLSEPLRDTDTVARLGGDEFAILLPPPTDLSTACQVAERVVEALSEPFYMEDLVLEVGVSIGVALHPEHGGTSSELLQHADVAMYAAKRSQVGFVVYSPESDTNSVRQLTLTGELRRAIEEDQLVLEYQPKMDARTAEIAGVEALIRWHHPTHGAIPPDEFIHSAEQTGLIKPLTLWVLNAALRDLCDWTATGHDFGVAVNLSVRSLQDPQLPDMVRLLLQSWDQRPERLTLEITESALMADPETALEVLERIAGIGCKLSLDDFGTGYSSLAYLQKLPIDELKIDRSFVVAMTRDDGAAVIVRSVVKLAKSLGLGVVAEGVESEHAFSCLRALDCDQVQGFFFGPAMKAENLMRWLKERPWTRGEQSLAAPAESV